jgi:hypothetical protein
MQSACAVLYCHLWHFRLYIIFHIITSTAQFSWEIYWTQNGFWVCLQLLSENFFIIGKTERDMIENVYLSLHMVSLIFYFSLIEVEYSQKIFEKSSHIKFYENTISWSRVPCVCGRTGGRTDLTKLVVLFEILRMCLIILKGLEHSQNRRSWLDFQ